QIGFGTWQLTDPAICETAVKTALDTGYRHIDTAQVYGNEAFVGRAITESGISREDIFLTTKIGTGNFDWDELPASFDESLKKLQTDYVDLLLLHFPVTQLRRPAWRQMETINKSGRAKAIGVSNYTVAHLEELLREGSIKPAVNQVELHVFLQQPELVKYCQDHGIVVEAYSPLAHGEGLSNPVLAEIAAKHHKTPVQIMLRWCLEIGTVPLPKSAHRERIQANFEVFDFKLDAGDMAQIKTLESDLRTCWDPTHVT
ncbi:MAG: Aldo/keto reductase, partial [Patescibacteria group bacterium]|nr:Aldo/keto reductase [Patescibacteria group bacterium]